MPGHSGDVLIFDVIPIADYKQRGIRFGRHGQCSFFQLRFWKQGRKCDLSAISCIISLYGLASNMDSHNHVIGLGLMGSAFSEEVVEVKKRSSIM